MNSRKFYFHGELPFRALPTGVMLIVEALMPQYT